MAALVCRNVPQDGTEQLVTNANPVKAHVSSVNTQAICALNAMR